MTAAKILVPDNRVVSMDLKTDPDENITEKDVADGKLLARFLLRLFRDVKKLQSPWQVRRGEVTFQDITAEKDDGSPPAIVPVQTLKLFHTFAGRVYWWPVSMRVELKDPDPAPGTALEVPVFVESRDTTAELLVLQVFYPAAYATRVDKVTFSLRLEQAG
jgi:hypothetical protein